MAKIHPGIFGLPEEAAPFKPVTEMTADEKAAYRKQSKEEHKLTRTGTAVQERRSQFRSEADRALFAFSVRNTRSIELECANRLDERSCNYLANNGYCNLRRESMELYCRRACKMCTDPPCHISKYGCCFDNTTLARGPNMLGCNDDCKDHLGKSYCTNLKRSGKCYEDHEKAIRECAVTCGYCRPCEDEDPVGCMFAAKYNGCSLKRGEMTNICRKSCDACGKKDPCFEFSCPKGSVCMVDENMRPFCKCHGHCHPGDHYTGILCGRDGKEYKNICELKKVNCGHHSLSRITVKNFGKCQSRGFAASDKRQLCSKKEPVLCRNWAARGYCKTRLQILRKMCPVSCHVCAAQASKPSCHYTKFGCCLDNKTPCKGTDYKGCPKFPDSVQRNVVDGPNSNIV
eukprot:gene15410-6650_t